MKSILKSTLYLAIFLIITGLMARLIFGTGVSWDQVPSSIAAGLLVGFIAALLTQWSTKRHLRNIVIPLEQAESIIKEGVANHLKGAERVRGKLVLTNKRLIFKSHQYARQNHQAVFAIDEITNVSKTKTSKLMPNGLTIMVDDNRTEKFVVESAGEWAEAIGARLRKITN